MAQKPLILAIETSSRIGSVAIALGEKLLAEKTFSAPIRHSAEIFPAIGGLLDKIGRNPRQIEHIYISIGPGSFTGLRIAVTIAKSMHLANAVKIVAVSTTDVIAANITELANIKKSPPSCRPKSYQAAPDSLATIIDAKRNQFFIAAYQRTSDKQSISPSPTTQYAIRNTQYEKTLPDSLMTASQFLDGFANTDKPIWLLGDGLLYCRDKFEADGIRFLDEKYWSPRAANVHTIGWQKALAEQFTDPLTLSPFYLRIPQVTIKTR